MTILRALCLATAMATIAAGAAQAETWREAHPRRAEVNRRLYDQNHRITQGVRDGQITPGQARALRSDDHAIRAEERADASINGGHITRGEQRTLNEQENANSAAIYRARH